MLYRFGANGACLLCFLAVVSLVGCGIDSMNSSPHTGGETRSSAVRHEGSRDDRECGPIAGSVPRGRWGRRRPRRRPWTSIGTEAGYCSGCFRGGQPEQRDRVAQRHAGGGVTGAVLAFYPQRAGTSDVGGRRGLRWGQAAGFWRWPRIRPAVYILLNTTPPGASTPSFAAPVAVGLKNPAPALAVADFNGDGKMDLAVADATLHQVGRPDRSKHPGQRRLCRRTELCGGGQRAGRSGVRGLRRRRAD